MRIRKDEQVYEETAVAIAKIADALAHPARVKILQYVAAKNEVRNDVCNGDLVTFLDYSQATISQHVKKLVTANLLTSRKQDKFTFYYINQETVSQFMQNLTKLTVQ